MTENRSIHQRIVVWATPDKKAQFIALAKSHGSSASKMLGLLVDSVLASNPVHQTTEERHVEADEEDRVTIRLRPGDRKLLRLRARSRGMNYTTYAAALIRAHVRANAPMPLEELARFERALAQVGAIGRNLGQMARAAREGRAIDPALGLELARVLQVAEELRQEFREVVRVNRISWESADAEATP